MAMDMPDSAPPGSLDALRAAIDSIDDQLQDLLIERAALVERIAGFKRAGRIAALRPGREAQILRRLVARHRGAFPPATLVRLWRELLSGTIAMQTDFAVAVQVAEGGADCWDLARDHYGSNTPMIPCHHSGEVLSVVAEGRAGVGVLPFPEEGASDLWWRRLGAAKDPRPRIIARLPFCGRGNARGGESGALVIGAFEPETSGEDVSLFALEASAELSRRSLLSGLAGGGLAPTPLAAAVESTRIAYLFEFDGALGGDDARLSAALAPLGEAVERVAFLGLYARPLALGAAGE